MLSKRIIARLDIKGSRLIKGVRFEGLRVVGDPSEAALHYYQQGVDELLYVDAVASLYGRNSLNTLLASASKNIFIPITAGGGIRSVDDASSVLRSGADKVAVNTAAVLDPSLITRLANAFGSQCVVASIQARRSSSLGWEVMVEAGRERTGIDVLSWISQVQELGVGEILLTSVDQDGTDRGPDNELAHSIQERVKVPLIFGGGISSTHEVSSLLSKNWISAVSLGSSLHKKRTSILDLKSFVLNNSDTFVRQTSDAPTTGDQCINLLSGINICIIDYRLGNQLSLFNALVYAGANVFISNLPDELGAADILILPGVGAFPQGISNLRVKIYSIGL